jgi:hypothetical protein
MAQILHIIIWSARLKTGKRALSSIQRKGGWSHDADTEYALGSSSLLVYY